MMTAHVLSGAIWIAGRWIETPDDLVVRAGDEDLRANFSVDGLFPGDRIPRADRVTQLGALVLGRAAAGQPSLAGDETAVLTASAVATAYTNERFERRRMEGKPPEPRSFPYTAPNAAAGEFAIALGARGPNMALVGGADVALIAIERACNLLARGACARVAIVATECPPPTRDVVSVAGVAAVECAAAIVLAREGEGPALRVRWDRASTAEPVTALASVGPIASVVLAARARAVASVTARSVGASVRIEIG